MATSVGTKLLGGGSKDNYVSSSDSDIDGEGATVTDDIPSTVVRPSADGLPQVRSVRQCMYIYMHARG